MDRRASAEHRSAWTTPHARGDGPVDPQGSKEHRETAPRPWGWTGDAANNRTTLVTAPRPWGWTGRDHLVTLIPTAPRPWGWTVSLSSKRRSAANLPTPVGMDRAQERLGSQAPNRPHARGDGPSLTHAKRGQNTIVPTPVGMDRRTRTVLRLMPNRPTPVGMDRLAWSR